jgi:hypothetical protein
MYPTSEEGRASREFLFFIAQASSLKTLEGDFLCLMFKKLKKL